MILEGLIIIVAVAIAVRDIYHYKISNVFLLLMTAIKCVDIIICLADNDWNAWIIVSSLTGAVTGFVIFFTASMTKYRLGAGDVKYSAVAGFVLGFGGYLWAMLIGCAAILIYSVMTHNICRNYLRRGFPMAPFISIGLIAVLVIRAL